MEQGNEWREKQCEVTPEFLERIDKLVAELVKTDDYHDPETGYISEAAWGKLVEGGILDSVLVARDPKKRHEEMMKTARALSRRDLHLGLTYGIVAALGVLPLQRFASSGEQLEEYLGLVASGNLIGLAITERLKSGSADLDMDSSYEVSEDGEKARVKISKHLQGLSGNAGMTVAVLKKGAARKTVGLFFVPQVFLKTQVTKMAGLKGISYAVNTADVTLNLKEHLLAELPRERLDEFQDIFTKSRFLFVAMSLGHIEKMEEEANKYASERVIEGRRQAEIPAVRGVLQQIRAHRIVGQAVFEKAMNYRDENNQSPTDGNTLPMVLEGNIIKTLVTEYAIQAAQLRAELMGGAAYYEGSALQDYIDIWPFQIFEGAKLFINNQIASEILGPTRKNGKVVLKGFFTAEDNNFATHFFEAIRDREMFDQKQILKNLDEWTGALLTQITPKNARPEMRGVIGEIIARLFALGTLNGSGQDQAKAILNLEIAQLTQNFAPWETAY